jgi:hypothetical protein
MRPRASWSSACKGLWESESIASYVHNLDTRWSGEFHILAALFPGKEGMVQVECEDG